MDDVIFAGNAARSALKGAEVAPMPDGGSFPGPVADLATV